MAVKTVGRAAAPREPRRDQARRRRAVLGAAVAALMAVVFTAGALLGAGTKASTAPRPASDGSATAAVAGVPIGHPQSRAGAIAAASDYAGALAQLALVGDSALAAGQREVFTPAALSAVGETARADARTTREELGSAAAGAVRHAPVGARLLAYGPTSARVALWVVHITSGPRGTPAAWWMTEQLSLSWDGSRWRVAEVSAGEGPVPAAAQSRASAAAALEEQLQLTEELRHAG